MSEAALERLVLVPRTKLADAFAPRRERRRIEWINVFRSRRSAMITFRVDVLSLRVITRGICAYGLIEADQSTCRHCFAGLNVMSTQLSCTCVSLARTNMWTLLDSLEH